MCARATAAAIDAIREGLPPGVELDDREEAILDLAARQAIDVARAESDLEARGYLVLGSRGQEVVNPSLSEARSGRLALGKLGAVGPWRSPPGAPCATLSGLPVLAGERPHDQGSDHRLRGDPSTWRRPSGCWGEGRATSSWTRSPACFASPGSRST
jgi:hypothetical protein